jgi:hypothetical protein
MMNAKVDGFLPCSFTFPDIESQTDPECVFIGAAAGHGHPS